MKNKIYSMFAVLSIVAVASLFAAGNGESLTVNKCGSCHKTEKFCKHLGKKDAAGWTKTVDAMIKKGAKVSVDEKKIIADYLAGLQKGAKPICK